MRKTEWDKFDRYMARHFDEYEIENTTVSTLCDVTFCGKSVPMPEFCTYGLRVRIGYEWKFAGSFNDDSSYHDIMELAKSAYRELKGLN